MNAGNKGQIHLQRYTWDTLPPNGAGTSPFPGSNTFVPTQGRTVTPSPGSYLSDLGTKLDTLTPFSQLLNEIGSLAPSSYLGDISDKLATLADLHRLLNEIGSLAPSSYLSDLSDKLTALTPFSRLLDEFASLPPDSYSIDTSRKLKALAAFHQLLYTVASLPTDPYLLNIRTALGTLTDLQRFLGEIGSLPSEPDLNDINTKLIALAPFSQSLDEVASLASNHYLIDINTRLNALADLYHLLGEIISLPPDLYLLNIGTELEALADLHSRLDEIASLLSNDSLINMSRKLDEVAPYRHLLDEIASLLSNDSLINMSRKLDMLTELRRRLDEIVPLDSYVASRKLNELLVSLPRNRYLINRSGKINDLKKYSRKLEEEIAALKKLLEKSKNVVKQATPPNKLLTHPVVAIVLFIVFCLLLANLVKPDLYNFLSNSCSSGSISINASVTMNPLLEQARADYQKQCPGATINIYPGQPSYDNELSSGGEESLISLVNNRTNIASIDTFAGSDQHKLTDNQTTIVIYAFVINSQNISLTNLTTKQIGDMYVSGVNNWSDIDNVSRTPPLPITGVSYPATAEISNIFEKYVLRDNNAFPGPPGLTSDTPEMALENVCRTPGAITYVPLYYAKAFLASPHGSNVCSLRMLSIDSKEPLGTNVTNNSYKFWSLEHLYTQDNATSLTKAFIDHIAMLSDPKNGYLSVADVPYAILDCHEKGVC